MPLANHNTCGALMRPSRYSEQCDAFKLGNRPRGRLYDLGVREVFRIGQIRTIYTIYVLYITISYVRNLILKYG